MKTVIVTFSGYIQFKNHTAIGRIAAYQLVKHNTAEAEGETQP